MKKTIAVSGLCLLMGLSYWALRAASPQNLDPIKVAGDTHKLVFENNLVRVLETKIPPGKTEPLHEHRHGVVVYLADFKVRTTEQGGQPQEAQRARGQVRWRERTVHSVINIGNSEGHVISVELK